jgi:hypothetical protein
VKKRVCRWPKCPTILSRHNPGEFCWTHTPEEKPGHREDPRVTSAAFLDNVVGAYKITPADRRNIYRGGGEAY